MVFWSLACASHGLATSVGMLAVSRLLLGMGEGGGFPAATRAVAEWFPVHERSTAMGIINAGTAVGGVDRAAADRAGASRTPTGAPSSISPAVVGLAWAVWWWLEYHPPEQHPRLGAAERTLLAPVIARRAPRPSARRRWLTLLRLRQTWGLVVAKFLSDAAWYFYLFWLPKYLYDARGFDIKAVGAFAWIPLRRGRRRLPGRRLALELAADARPAARSRAQDRARPERGRSCRRCWFVPSAPVAWALAIFSLAYFGQQSWSTLVMILPADMFPRNAVGAVAGLVGFGGAMGGVVFGQVVGYAARSRLRLRHRLRARRLVPRARVRHHLPGHPDDPARRDAAVTLRYPRHRMKITEIRTRVVRVARQDRAAAAAFLHQPDGPAARLPRGRRWRRSPSTAG